ncbi:MAG: hypothetical protein Q7R57_06895 [Dehalococcoidales bacterium]|nr:hypothetical protein [Dehalococcoidales bacterium]
MAKFLTTLKAQAEIEGIINNAQKGLEILSPYPEKPLCPDCYKIWERYWDPEYVENFCHVCGKSDNTSFVKPLCRACFEKTRGR